MQIINKINKNIRSNSLLLRRCYCLFISLVLISNNILPALSLINENTIIAQNPKGNVFEIDTTNTDGDNADIEIQEEKNCNTVQLQPIDFYMASPQTKTSLPDPFSSITFSSLSGNQTKLSELDHSAQNQRLAWSILGYPTVFALTHNGDGKFINVTSSSSPIRNLIGVPSDALKVKSIVLGGYLPSVKSSINGDELFTVGADPHGGGNKPYLYNFTSSDSQGTFNRSAETLNNKYLGFSNGLDVTPSGSLVLGVENGELSGVWKSVSKALTSASKIKDFTKSYINHFEVDDLPILSNQVFGVAGYEVPDTYKYSNILSLIEDSANASNQFGFTLFAVDQTVNNQSNINLLGKSDFWGAGLNQILGSPNATIAGLKVKNNYLFVSYFVNNGIDFKKFYTENSPKYKTWIDPVTGLPPSAFSYKDGLFDSRLAVFKFDLSGNKINLIKIANLSTVFDSPSCSGKSYGISGPIEVSSQGLIFVADKVYSNAIRAFKLDPSSISQVVPASTPVVIPLSSPRVQEVLSTSKYKPIGNDFGFSTSISDIAIDPNSRVLFVSFPYIESEPSSPGNIHINGFLSTVYISDSIDKCSSIASSDSCDSDALNKKKDKTPKDENQNMDQNVISETPAIKKIFKKLTVQDLGTQLGLPTVEIKMPVDTSSVDNGTTYNKGFKTVDLDVSSESNSSNDVRISVGARGVNFASLIQLKPTTPGTPAYPLLKRDVVSISSTTSARAGIDTFGRAVTIIPGSNKIVALSSGNKIFANRTDEAVLQSDFKSEETSPGIISSIPQTNNRFAVLNSPPDSSKPESNSLTFFSLEKDVSPVTLKDALGKIEDQSVTVQAKVPYSLKFKTNSLEISQAKSKQNQNQLLGLSYYAHNLKSKGIKYYLDKALSQNPNFTQDNESNLQNLLSTFQGFSIFSVPSANNLESSDQIELNTSKNFYINELPEQLKSPSESIKRFIAGATLFQNPRTKETYIAVSSYDAKVAGLVQVQSVPKKYDSGIYSTVKPPGLVNRNLIYNLDAKSVSSDGKTAKDAAKEGIGSWSDLTGSGLNAELKNIDNSDWVGDGTPAKPYALTFDSVDNFVSVPQSALDSIRRTNSYTVELVFNVDSSHKNYVSLFSRGLDQRILLDQNNNVIVNTYNKDTTNTGVKVNPNEWHHIALTKDESNLAKLHLDGNVVWQEDKDKVFDKSKPISIGASLSTNPYLFSGQIASVRVYNSALNDTEVKQNYDTELFRFNDVETIVALQGIEQPKTRKAITANRTNSAPVLTQVPEQYVDDNETFLPFFTPSSDVDNDPLTFVITKVGPLLGFNSKTANGDPGEKAQNLDLNDPAGYFSDRKKMEDLEINALKNRVSQLSAPSSQLYGVRPQSYFEAPELTIPELVIARSATTKQSHLRNTLIDCHASFHSARNDETYLDGGYFSSSKYLSPNSVIRVQVMSCSSAPECQPYSCDVPNMTCFTMCTNPAECYPAESNSCQAGMCVGGGGGGGNSCMTDSDCGPGKVCRNGTCVVGGGACMSNADCFQGYACNTVGSFCYTNCMNDNECDTGYTCDLDPGSPTDHTCVMVGGNGGMCDPVCGGSSPGCCADNQCHVCCIDSDCPPSNECVGYACQPVMACIVNSDCPSDKPVCVSMSCEVCGADTDCMSSAPYCLGLNCVECTQDSHCMSGETCVNNSCTMSCNLPSECDPYSCNAVAMTCFTSCSAPTECYPAEANSCQNGMCGGGGGGNQGSGNNCCFRKIDQGDGSGNEAKNFSCDGQELTWESNGAYEHHFEKYTSDGTSPDKQCRGSGNGGACGGCTSLNTGADGTYNVRVCSNIPSDSTNTDGVELIFKSGSNVNCDPISCMTNADCMGYLCSSNFCTDSCMVSSDCAMGYVCNDDSCVACTSCMVDGDCGSGKICNLGFCTSKMFSEVGMDTLPQDFEFPTALVVNDKIWLYENSNANNIIHSSLDGKNWSEEGSINVSLISKIVSFNNKFWMFREDNLAYSSVDGKIWTVETGVNGLLSMQGSGGCVPVVHDNKIWLLGGGLGKQVYNSADGISWQKIGNNTLNINGLNEINPLPVEFSNRMWILGGDQVSYPKKIVYSTDGITWTNAADLPDGSGVFTTLVYDKKLWIVGGLRDNDFDGSVYYTSDGTSWTKVIALPSEVYNHASVVFKNKMWIFGGSSSKTKVFAFPTDGSESCIGDNSCSADSDCGMGYVCNSGSCVVGCLLNSNCQSGETCQSGRCVSSGSCMCGTLNPNQSKCISSKAFYQCTSAGGSCKLEVSNCTNQTCVNDQISVMATCKTLASSSSGAPKIKTSSSSSSGDVSSSSSSGSIKQPKPPTITHRPGSEQTINLSDLGINFDSMTGRFSGRTNNISDRFNSTLSRVPITVYATDGTSQSNEISFNLIIRSNNHNPSLVNPGDKIYKEGKTIALSLLGNDEDNDPLTYYVDQLPSGLTLDKSSGVISGEIRDVTNGTDPVLFPIKAYAWDGHTDGFTQLVSFTLTIKPGDNNSKDVVYNVSTKRIFLDGGLSYKENIILVQHSPGGGGGGEGCTSDEECPPGEACRNNVCTISNDGGGSGSGGGSGIGQRCYIDSDCQPDQMCINFSCVSNSGNGGACNPTCASDQKCCDGACHVGKCCDDGDCEVGKKCKLISDVWQCVSDSGNTNCNRIPEYNDCDYCTQCKGGLAVKSDDNIAGNDDSCSCFSPDGVFIGGPPAHSTNPTCTTCRNGNGGGELCNASLLSHSCGSNMICCEGSTNIPTCYDGACCKDTDCMTGQRCNGNEHRCEENSGTSCMGDSECKSTEACIDSKCKEVECKGDSDCDSGDGSGSGNNGSPPTLFKACRHYKCVGVICRANDDDCKNNIAGKYCVNDGCTECKEDKHCSEGKICSANLCVIKRECLSDSECSLKQICTDKKCVDVECKSNPDCAKDFICNKDHKCVKEVSPGSCKSKSECIGSNPLCCNSKCSVGDCCINADCAKDLTCNKDHKCVKELPAGSCKSQSDCLGNNALCCNSNCATGNCCKDQDCQIGFKCDGNLCIQSEISVGTGVAPVDSIAPGIRFNFTDSLFPGGVINGYASDEGSNSYGSNSADNIKDLRCSIDGKEAQIVNSSDLDTIFGGIKFNPTKDQKIQLPLTGVLNKWTIETLIRLDDRSLGREQVVFKGTDIGVFVGNGLLKLQGRSADGRTIKFVSNKPLEPNIWHYITITSDGINTKLFVNGKFIGSDISIPFNFNDSLLGGDFAGNTFSGSIAKIAVYERPMSDDEINKNNRYRLDPYDIRGLNGYWNFLETSDNTVIGYKNDNNTSGTKKGSSNLPNDNEVSEVSTVSSKPTLPKGSKDSGEEDDSDSSKQPATVKSTSGNNSSGGKKSPVKSKNSLLKARELSPSELKAILLGFDSNYQIGEDAYYYSIKQYDIGIPTFSESELSKSHVLKCTLSDINSNFVRDEFEGSFNIASNIPDFNSNEENIEEPTIIEEDITSEEVDPCCYCLGGALKCKPGIEAFSLQGEVVCDKENNLITRVGQKYIKDDISRRCVEASLLTTKEEDQKPLAAPEDEVTSDDNLFFPGSTDGGFLYTKADMGLDMSASNARLLGRTAHLAKQEAASSVYIRTSGFDDKIACKENVGKFVIKGYDPLSNIPTNFEYNSSKLTVYKVKEIEDSIALKLVTEVDTSTYLEDECTRSVQAAVAGPVVFDKSRKEIIVADSHGVNVSRSFGVNFLQKPGKIRLDEKDKVNVAPAYQGNISDVVVTPNYDGVHYLVYSKVFDKNYDHNLIFYPLADGVGDAEAIDNGSPGGGGDQVANAPIFIPGFGAGIPPDDKENKDDVSNNKDSDTDDSNEEANKDDGQKPKDQDTQKPADASPEDSLSDASKSDVKLDPEKGSKKDDKNNKEKKKEKEIGCNESKDCLKHGQNLFCVELKSKGVCIDPAKKISKGGKVRLGTCLKNEVKFQGRKKVELFCVPTRLHMESKVGKKPLNKAKI